MSDLARWYERQGDIAGALRWRLRSAVYMRELYKLDALRKATHASTEAARVVPDQPSANATIARIQRRAARGDAEAQVDLGALHEAGIGMPTDMREALHWYQRAGEQGNVYGQYFSGLALGRGSKTLPKDETAAAAWFARAQAQEFYLAEESYWRRAIAPPFFIFE